MGRQYQPYDRAHRCPWRIRLTLGDPPVLAGRIWMSAAGARKDRCAAVGIALGREHTGRGYGTDAMRIIAGYGFRELGLHRIELGVAAFNSAGIRPAGAAPRRCLD